MDMIAAYAETGSFRAAADMCGTTHKTVSRVVAEHEAASAGQAPASRAARGHNYDVVADLVAEKVARTKGRISAKRLLPVARAAGYAGSGRNFRRLVARAKRQWRDTQPHRGRRPAVWVPGDTLVIDWGVLDGLHVFCAVLAWSRVRFVRFAADETAQTTFGLLVECFEAIGGVPKVVLADRMGCLKGGVVADVVIPTPDYVRFATHYGFRPDFCQASDPASKGIVENLVSYAKYDLMVPLAELGEAPGLAGAGMGQVNAAAVAWCSQVNTTEHSEICAVPAQRLERERELLGALPSLRPVFGPAPVTRRVDKLSCIRFASARYSVPNRLVSQTVTVLVDTHQRRLTVVNPVTGEIHADHPLVAPGETSITDAHYDRPRPDRPRRAARAKTPTEKAFLGLGPVAEAFLAGAAAAGVTKLPAEIKTIMDLHAAHGSEQLLPALSRAVEFRRWRAADIRSILATNGQAPDPTPPGQVLVLTLPTVPTRPLSAYAISTPGGDRA